MNRQKPLRPNIEDSNNPIEVLLGKVNSLTTEIQQMYCADEIPWVIGYSGGKDSTAVLQLIWTALESLPEKKRLKKLYVITTDTMVENPIVSQWVNHSVESIRRVARQKNLNIEPHILHPAIDSTFWVCLIGKGYPAPRNKFRWCTDRLKIQASNKFIRKVVRENGETILALGTRKAESRKRAETMKRHELKRVRERLSPNSRLINSLVYSPIEDWTTDEVWMYLMQWNNPWGHDNQHLLTMYRGATADNECPLVVDTTTPSCGSSRFGCWVCTMVNQDKSMEAMIQNDEEKEWMQPLLDIRNELDLKNDRDRRDFRRIHGNVQLFERNKNGEMSVEPIPGPYTKKWREHWLRRVLEAQETVRRTAPPEMRDITLITTEELSEIRRIWLEEKHEFDDRLPTVYREVTGKPFQDPRPGADQSLLGLDEWNILEDLADGDAMELELMAKLLDTERQYHTKLNRKGIYEALEKCFETSSRSPEEAIANAHRKRELKEAAAAGDVAKVKQLTWSDLKFGDSPDS